MTTETPSASTTELGTTTGRDPGDRELGAGHRDGDPEQAADEAQQGRLHEELAEDRAARGADGLADADLAGPLGDRDQHDVGDPDPADQQADRRHGRRAGR